MLEDNSYTTVILISVTTECPMRSFEDDIKIEKAIKYLSRIMDESGNNPKPVVLHSTRVAMRLYNLGYETDIVVAAFLHDLLEDSAARADNISLEFGERVLELIKGNTFDISIKDESERYKETFARLLAVGKDAVIIKAFDILDNSDFYSFKQGDKSNIVLNKMGFFLEVSRDLLGEEPVYKELFSRYSKFCEQVNS